MLKNFNLLISCPRFHEKDAIAELWYLYSNIGDEEVSGTPTSFPGLVVAKTNMEPIDSIRKLRTLLEEDPLYLRFVLKIIPIEKVVETTLENIVEVVKELGRNVDAAETFRITLKSRFSPLNSRELIIEAASYIDREVNLTNPDRIVMIQILGGITGISLLRPGNILLKVEFPI